MEMDIWLMRAFKFFFVLFNKKLAKNSGKERKVSMATSNACTSEDSVYTFKKNVPSFILPMETGP